MARSSPDPAGPGGPIAPGDGAAGARADARGAATTWLLLSYKIPREPSAGRVAVWRRLKRLWRNRAMKWVTWEQVGVDRMACAWLIRRFVDPQAAFVFVPVGWAPLPGDAEPFDIPGVRLAHRGGHCTFHTLLREYALTDPV